MRKTIHLLLACFLLTALTLSAQVGTTTKVPASLLPAQSGFKKLAPAQMATAPMLEPSASNPELSYCVAAYCTNLGNGVTNYYIILTSAPGSFDASSGTVIFENDEKAWLTAFDIYAPTVENGFKLSDGEYASKKDSTAFSFHPSYSGTSYINNAGEGTGYRITSAPIQITNLENGDVQIEWTITSGLVTKEAVFRGPIELRRQPTIQSPWPLIGEDMDLAFTGSLALYQGNFFNSKTGNILLNLYDTDFDPETGAHTGVGNCLQICLFNTLFGEAKDICIKPGTYKMARNFQRLTWYPGLVIDNMGQSVVMGSFCQRRLEDKSIAVAFMSEGEFTVAMDTDSVYTINVQMTTDDGYKVKGQYVGKITIFDESQDNPGAIISTLKQDYELNLDQIPVARAWKEDIQEGCSRYYLDIGSPSGRDSVLVKNGGDIFRIDMLLEMGAKSFTSGLYTVMEREYPSDYKPFALRRGHFENGGDLCGTRWFHFREGSDMVADGLAPAYYGTVDLRYISSDSVKVIIDVIDDGGYAITGEWQGPVEYMYDLPVGIEEQLAAPEFTWKDKQTVLLGGVRPTDRVVVYTPGGEEVMSRTGASSLDLGHLNPGMYIIKVGSRPAIKVAR